MSSVESDSATLRVPEETMSKAPPAPRSCAAAMSNEVSTVSPAAMTWKASSSRPATLMRSLIPSNAILEAIAISEQS